MQYLYLNNMYCSKSNDVKKMLSDRANQMNKDFRKEVLALFRDGVLDNWFSEISSLDKTALDDNLFVDLVQTITGNTVSGDIRSKFNDVGELVRIEFGDKSYDVANGVVNITNFKPGNIKFIFKCLRPENNEFSFNYYNQTKKLNWNDYARNQEIALEFNSDNEGNFELKEGNGNVLFEVKINLIPDCAVDLGLSVYWADKDLKDCIGNIKENITKEFGEGWRLPTADEARELLHTKITKCSKSEEINILFKPQYYWLFTGNNNTIQLEYTGYLLSDGGYFCTNLSPIMGFSYQNIYNFEVRPVYDKNN